MWVKPPTHTPLPLVLLGDTTNNHKNITWYEETCLLLLSLYLLKKLNPWVGVKKTTKRLTTKEFMDLICFLWGKPDLNGPSCITSIPCSSKYLHSFSAVNFELSSMSKNIWWCTKAKVCISTCSAYMNEDQEKHWYVIYKWTNSTWSVKWLESFYIHTDLTPPQQKIKCERSWGEVLLKCYRGSDYNPVGTNLVQSFAQTFAWSRFACVPHSIWFVIEQAYTKLLDNKN